MKYHVEITKEAQKALKKMDKHTAKVITSWIKEHLEGCEDPYAFGKGLTSNRSGQWRYRVEDYRILAIIQDNQVLITVFKIAHRREVYDD